MKDHWWCQLLSTSDIVGTYIYTDRKKSKRADLTDILYDLC